MFKWLEDLIHIKMNTFFVQHSLKLSMYALSNYASSSVSKIVETLIICVVQGLILNLTSLFFYGCLPGCKRKNSAFGALNN